MYVCTFTVTEYGTSGNELPPPPERSYSLSMLSAGESEDEFKARMQAQGMTIREHLAAAFREKPKPYSCASSCSWTISRVVSEIALHS